ncbi:cytochrome P450 4Z1-like isoform X2 [Dermacentor albipictus]|uniref:cytochrome P450 4Z1-like isoform X2 n=1 Tax=Dermacentor albipictus TaxID=60249 RepID=UPI0038FD386A
MMQVFALAVRLLLTVPPSASCGSVPSANLPYHNQHISDQPATSSELHAPLLPSVYRISDHQWTTPSPGTSSAAATKRVRSSPPLCGPGSCATVQSTNPLLFMMQVFALAVRLLLTVPPSASCGSVPSANLPYHNQHISDQPATSSELHAPLLPSVYRISDHQWTTPSPGTSSAAATKRVRSSPPLCGPGSCATVQSTNPLLFMMQVLFEGSTAIGVEYNRYIGSRMVRAKREVILSAGAIGSAQLLMLSGIGPRLDLEALQVIERRKSAILRKLAEQSYNDELDDELSFPAAVDAAIRKHISGPSSYTLDELEKDATSVTFAAADSTSAAMSWTLYLLGLNPDKQAKLQKELDDALGRGIEADITTSDLKQLPYLECCIKESLRLCPPFPLIGRELDEELVIDGYTVPAGTTCMINIHSLHRNTEQFADPENYIPERFLPENCKNMHPFSFIPFSSGVRVCLGQKFVMVEAKVLLAKLLSKYTVESTQPLEEVKQAYEVVLKARGGLRVWFRKRGDPV